MLSGFRLGKPAALTRRCTCLAISDNLICPAVNVNALRRPQPWSSAFYKKVASQEEYERIRARYGDTTSVFAHVEALTSLGLRVRFVDNADAEDVMEAIDAGIPVLVGWLHQGNMLRGEPPMCSDLTCGHWSILHGYSGRYSSDPSWLMTDPAGLPDIERGGHNPALSGYRVSVRQAAFYQRWQDRGSRSGWAIFVEQ